MNNPARLWASLHLRALLVRQRGLWLGICVLAAIGGWLVVYHNPQPVDVTWQQMQERGSWRVGMDPSFPPFETLNAQGAPVGYDVDLAREIADQWGLEVEIVAIGFDSLLDALQVQRVDAVISALPFDARRTQDVFYSLPYFEAGIRLVVEAEAEIAAVDDLAGRSVAVEWGSRGDAVARRLQRDGVALERLTFQSSQEAITALVSGASDALLIDGVTLQLAQGKGQPIRPVGSALESDPYVIAVPIDAPELQKAVNESLETLQQNGRLGLLQTRWLGRNP